MKVIEMDEAQNWLKRTGSEDTLIVERATRYDSDENALCYILFLAMLEEKEPSEEYPDAMAINFYGKIGWALTENELAERAEGGTLIDKLVDECGHRCGDIYIDGEEDIVDKYVDYANEKNAVFILGIDSEIQQVLPHLANGVYCFLFEEEAVIREQYFREQERMYRRSDAEDAVEQYCDWRCSDMYSVPADIQEMLMSRADNIVAWFDKKYDSDIDENTQWENAVDTEAQQIILDAVKDDRKIMSIINDASSALGYYYLKAAYMKMTGKEIPFDNTDEFDAWCQDMFLDYVQSIGMETAYGCVADMNLTVFTDFYRFVTDKVHKATTKKPKKKA